MHRWPASITESLHDDATPSYNIYHIHSEREAMWKGYAAKASRNSTCGENCGAQPYLIPPAPSVISALVGMPVLVSDSRTWVGHISGTRAAVQMDKICS